MPHGNVQHVGKWHSNSFVAVPFSFLLDRRTGSTSPKLLKTVKCLPFQHHSVDHKTLKKCVNKLATFESPIPKIFVANLALVINCTIFVALLETIFAILFRISIIVPVFFNLEPQPVGMDMKTMITSAIKIHLSHAFENKATSNVFYLELFSAHFSIALTSIWTFLQHFITDFLQPWWRQP